MRHICSTKISQKTTAYPQSHQSSLIGRSDLNPVLPLRSRHRPQSLHHNLRIHQHPPDGHQVRYVADKFLRRLWTEVWIPCLTTDYDLLVCFHALFTLLRIILHDVVPGFLYGSFQIILDYWNSRYEHTAGLLIRISFWKSEDPLAAHKAWYPCLWS